MSENNLEQQRKDFNNLLAQLKIADDEEIENVLAQREITNPEPELTSNAIDRLKAKIQNKKS